MRILIAACALALVPASASADTYVKGYFKNNGTYVQPHYRSNNDGYKWNNYSTQGNINPYTGKAGTVNPYGGYSGYQGYTGYQGYSGYKGYGGY